MISLRKLAVTTVALVLGVDPMVSAQGQEAPRRGQLRIATIHSAGDKDVIPLAVPNLTKMLRDRFNFDVVIDPKEVSLRDPTLINYPVVYFHGQSAVDFSKEDQIVLRRHLDPGGGVLFVDAACGNPDFDAAFRKFVAELFPKNPLVSIPKNDDFYTRKRGDNLSLANAKQTAAAGGKNGFPDLEGVQIDGRWAIIYSKLDVGSALQKQADIECKGYTHDTAMRIGAKCVLYATLP